MEGTTNSVTFYLTQHQKCGTKTCLVIYVRTLIQEGSQNGNSTRTFCKKAECNDKSTITQMTLLYLSSTALKVKQYIYATEIEVSGYSLATCHEEPW